MPRNDETLATKKPIAPLGIIPMESISGVGARVDQYLSEWRADRSSDHLDEVTKLSYHSGSYIVAAKVPRFGSGEAKGEIHQSVRGLDVYIMTDVTNYSLTYKLCGQVNHYSPDDHYADLKRIIAAIEGKANRITVILPFLYESRQHKRSSRESLDCAIALQELINMGVDNIITFDAHDPRVQNAIPLKGFETVQPAYQFIKGILKNVKDLKIDNVGTAGVGEAESTSIAVVIASISAP